MGGKVKNENVKVEKKDGSHYYIANMDLKKTEKLGSLIKVKEFIARNILN